ncbi:MAG: tetratricopeptide repeat protein, partial [Polyangiales bacterium]
ATMDNGAAEDLEENIHQARTSNNSAQVQTLQQQQTTLRNQARQWREQLITAFRALVQDHPNYPQMDRALFSLAFAYQEANNFNEARTVYRTLIQRFPNSPFVPNAYLSFAEYFFDQGEMENARQFYERVLQVQDESNQVYGYALYKMAWVQFNLQDFQASLQRFFDVIEYGRNHPNAPSVTPLLRNARMELVSVYGQVYGTAQRPLNPANAFNTFQRYAADENNAFEMFEKLAELYHDGGQWPNSIATYHALMERRPNSDRFCVWQAQVARAVVAGRASNPERMTEVQRLLDVYETYRSSNRPQEAKNECRNHAARVAFDVASHWHLEAVGRSAEGQQQTRGTRSPETMRLTGELYQKILDTFPDLDQVEFTEYDRRDWPTRYRIAYYRADILRDQGDNEHCGPAYDAVVDMNPQGEFTEDASYKAVLCYNDWFQNQFQVQRNPTANARRETPGRGRNQPTQEQQLAERRRGAVPREFNQMEQAMLRAPVPCSCSGAGPAAGRRGPGHPHGGADHRHRRTSTTTPTVRGGRQPAVAHSDPAAPDPRTSARSLATPTSTRST